MGKKKKRYVCTDCGVDYGKWQGQCGACKEWNTLKEFWVLEKPASVAHIAGIDEPQLELLSDLEDTPLERMSSGMEEMDRVLGGGGFVPGSVVLLGGDPGAGKSTLLLQVSAYLSKSKKVLYMTGEESLRQVSMRAKRLELTEHDILVGSETRVENIINLAEKHKPDLLVIDSIQTVNIETVEGAPGTVSQVRESAAALIRLSKQKEITLVLVGHVNKEGNLAGPKVLEHMIDCFLMLESGADSRFRNLRGLKNRFGATGELGMFAMLGNGLKEVSNPSAILLSRDGEPASGSIITVLWEGTRSLLLEIQALVDDGQNSFARRLAVGLDQNRLVLQLAILHKHGGVGMVGQDVFLNVVGGLKITETASDLAVIMAILSSFRNKPLPMNMVVFGEVGLSGEIRPVPHGQERLAEAARHGFQTALIPFNNKPTKSTAKNITKNMDIYPMRKLSEVLAWLKEHS